MIPLEVRKREREIEITQLWIKNFVLRYGLCPFAEHSFKNDLILYKYSRSKKLKEHLASFWEVIQVMLDIQSNYYSNAFLIISDNISYKGLRKLSSVCDELLRQVKVEDNFQLVEFHPKFIFKGIEYNDAANFVNRSPFPMLHILRKDEVEEAIDSYPNISQVPMLNAQTMEEIGYKKLSALLEHYRNMVNY